LAPFQDYVPYGGGGAGAKLLAGNAIWGPNRKAAMTLWFSIELKYTAPISDQPSGNCAVLYSKQDYQGDWVEVCQNIPRINFRVQSVWVPPTAT